jgi:LuxR family maltose regulon positive regulatory protein
MLQALAAQATGDKTTALNLFGQALRLAQPAGYFRMFVDEGTALAPLLQRAIAAQMLPDYAAAILAAMGNSDATTLDQPLADPLSPRELEVLRLFQTELTGPQIADELVVALSTIRSHTKQIYSKLGVSNRRAAVNRAAALGLLDS